MSEKAMVLNRIVSEGLIPVIRLDTKEGALEAAQAVLDGGASVVEVTMNVPKAMDVIGFLRSEMGQVVVGAGTVLDAQTARAAIMAGAQLVVSPIWDSGIISTCRRYGVVSIPGAMTPTEVLQAFEAGADMVKVFPAGALGGPSYIKALKAPLPQVPLVPTGGVNLQNAGGYIIAGAVALGVGGELVGRDLVRQGKWEEITNRTRSFLKAIAEARTRS